MANKKKKKKKKKKKNPTKSHHIASPPLRLLSMKRYCNLLCRLQHNIGM
jgi:hypothetical protein